MYVVLPTINRDFLSSFRNALFAFPTELQIYYQYSVLWRFFLRADFLVSVISIARAIWSISEKVVFPELCELFARF